MSNETGRFIPTAQRATQGQDDWWISLKEGHAFVMSEKDGIWFFSETAAQYNLPSGYLIALVEAAKLREALKGSQESGLACEKKLNWSQQAILSHWPKVREKLGLALGHTDEAVLNEISRISEDRKEALQQVENLGKFIGHPGATPAHVVSETVSLIEKFLKAADLAGCKMDQAATGIAEEMLQCYYDNVPLRQTMIALGRRLGFTRVEELTPLGVLEAVNLKLDHYEARIVEEMVGIRNHRREFIDFRSKVCAAAGISPGTAEDKIVEEIQIGFAGLRDTEKEAAEWRQSSETWQKRAEADISGVSAREAIGMAGKLLTALHNQTEEELPNVVEFEAPGIGLRLEGTPDPNSIGRMLKLVEAFIADNEAKH